MKSKCQFGLRLETVSVFYAWITAMVRRDKCQRHCVIILSVLKCVPTTKKTFPLKEHHCCGVMLSVAQRFFSSFFFFYFFLYFFLAKRVNEVVDWMVMFAIVKKCLKRNVPPSPSPPPANIANYVTFMTEYIYSHIKLYFMLMRTCKRHPIVSVTVQHQHD